MAKRAVMRLFAKADLDAGTDAESGGEAAQAAIKGATLVPEVATADSLWSPPDKLALYQCMT